jgi:hypothetical protein
MSMDKNRIKELKSEGYAEIAGVIEDKYFSRGQEDGKINTLRNILIESIQKKNGGIEPLICKKISLLDDEKVLKEFILATFDIEDVSDIYRLVDDSLSDENMYRKEGYEQAIAKKKYFYACGMNEGSITTKQSIINSILKNNFGEIGLELKANINTRDSEESLDELIDQLLVIDNKQDVDSYIEKTMTGANRLKSEGCLAGCKESILKNILHEKFGSIDSSLICRISNVRSVQKIDFLTKKALEKNTMKEFLNELDAL